jgi:ubiquinone/menaquinone biosynthesis C-methylase UbiE
VASLLRPLRSDRILDVGTGAGHTAAFLARWSDDVVGLDPEPDMLAAARRAYGELTGVRFVLGTGQEPPFGPNEFDAAVARHTLHHHRDVAATLRGIHRVLRPGGRFVLVDETAPSPAHAPWLERIERERDPSHVSMRSLDEWADLLVDAGFAWLTGDSRTRYRLEVDAWLDRMEAPEATRERVHALFGQADADARSALAIEFDGDRAVRFELPMNLVLALKEEP